MFLDDSAFEELGDDNRVNSKYRTIENRPSTANGPKQSDALEDFEENDDLPAFRSASAGTASTSRARIMAQQRELQLKKRQSSVQAGGMIRSSIDSNASGSPMKQSDGQFTPAVRQFSAPKSVRESAEYGDAQSSEFGPPSRSSQRPSDRSGRDAGPGSRSAASASASANGRGSRQKYSDDEADDRDRDRDRRRRDDGDDDDRGGRGGHRDKAGSGRKPRRDDDRGSHRDDDNDSGDDYRWGSKDKGRRDDRDRDRGDRDRDRGSRSTSKPKDRDRDRDDYDDRDREERRHGSSRPSKADKADRGDRDRDRDRGDRDKDKDRDGRWGDKDAAKDKDRDRPRDRDARDRDEGKEREDERPSNAAAAPRQVFSPPDYSNMRHFLTSPLPKKVGVLQCYIRRNKNGTNKLFPIYSLYLKEGDVFLMASKKRPKNKTSNYLISMDQNDLNRSGSNYLGKLRSNFVGTEFQIFDNGINPKDSEADEGASGDGPVRCELGAVMYAANVLGSRGPRKMQVATPGLDESGNIIRWRDGSGAAGAGAADDMLNRMKDRNFRDLVYLINKPPRWNEQVGAYVLNFNGRVTMASVKNFQLVDPDEQNAVVLQFGRVGKDEFTMDLQWPISPFQAFAITLSSFDSKIACD